MGSTGMSEFSYIKFNQISDEKLIMSAEAQNVFGYTASKCLNFDSLMPFACTKVFCCSWGKWVVSLDT